MKKGTQAMLDAAKDDATLLPFDTMFRTSKKSTLGKGVAVVRSRNKYCCNDRGSVGFEIADGTGTVYHHFVTDLLPAKKSKPKKWQNGTQAQLNAAKYDARLIPKKTYFRSKISIMGVATCYVIQCEENDNESVLMMEIIESGDVMSRCWFHTAKDLEPIND